MNPSFLVTIPISPRLSVTSGFGSEEEDEEEEEPIEVDDEECIGGTEGAP